jgi:hypothetical protein
MPAPDCVLKLCETFADHRDHYPIFKRIENP